MNNRATYTEEQKAFILLHHKEYSCQELADNLNLSYYVVYQIGYLAKLIFKKGVYKSRLKASRADSVAPVKIMRPPAIYSNLKSNYL